MDCDEGDYNCENDIVFFFSVGHWVPGRWWNKNFPWDIDTDINDNANFRTLLENYTNFFDKWNSAKNGNEPPATFGERKKLIQGCQYLSVKYKGTWTKYACDDLDEIIPEKFTFDLSGTQKHTKLNVDVLLHSATSNLKTEITVRV